MFGIFDSKKAINPVEAFQRIETVLLPIQEEKFLFKGILFPKDSKKKYSTFSLRVTEAIVSETKEKDKHTLDLSKVNLQVFDLGDSPLKEAIHHEVIIEGRLEIKIWYNTSNASISVKEPRLVKKIRKLDIVNDNDIVEIRELFQKNPAKKLRGEDLVQTLTKKVENNKKLSVLVIGPRGKGRDDILYEFDRAKGLENYVSLFTLDRSLSPSSLNLEQVEEHFTNLAKDLKELSDTKRYDLIVYARGGGDPYQLETLNNKIFCEAIIVSKTPICVSVAHSSDELWIKQSADLITNVPALLISELARAVNTAKPGAVDIRAMGQSHSQNYSSGFGFIWIILVLLLIGLGFAVYFVLNR